MASARQRKSGRWQIILWDRGARRQASMILPASVKSRRSAITIARQKQDELDRAAAGLTPSLPESAPGWLSEARRTLREVELTATPSWLASCKRFVDRFADFLGGDPPASAITETQCRDYMLARLASGSSPSYVRKELTFLSRILRRAGNDAFRAIRKVDFLRE